jgi:membrane associated rhomboid family serine protease
MPFPLDTPTRRIVVVALTVLIAATIGYLTLIPLNMPASVPGSDKAHHLMAFALLTLPCAVLSPRSLVLLVPVAITYGGAIEWLQPKVGRHGEVADFYADLAGVIIGVGMGLFLRRIIRRRIQTA